MKAGLGVAFSALCVWILSASVAYAQFADTSGIDSTGGALKRVVPEEDTVYVIRGGTDYESKSPYRREIRAMKDTILVLTREGTKDFLGSFRGQGRNARERGFGGALGVSPSVYAVHMKPVYDLVQRYPDLRNIGFNIDDGYGMFVLMGGLGYGAVGNGLRIGGGGRGGSNDFTRTRNDTTYTLEVGVGFGGFMLEKAFVRRNANFFIGGMLGGGGLNIELREYHGLFQTIGRSGDDLPIGTADASYLLLELHTGITYTLLSWLHIGGDISVPAFLSPSGFKVQSSASAGDGFVTFNPGIRIRIMFGNIG